MHTMAKVKNAFLADDDDPEPPARLIGEEQVVEAADRLVASTDDEAKQLIELYAADPGKVAVVLPGVDLDLFRPGDPAAARRRLGLRPDAVLLTFVGRIQPLKAPDILLRAAARILRRHPDLRDRLVVAVVGGASGTGLDHPDAYAGLAHRLGIEDVTRFVEPVPPGELAGWYQASTAVCVPSYSESFGLVALEAQACGTPVVAASVGGLATAVASGRSGLLVDGHDPEAYGDALARLVLEPGLRDRLGAAAVGHARGFGWEVTAERTLQVYTESIAALRLEVGT
jgi:D-inositol-3-phosphate glycosyltransferase